MAQFFNSGSLCTEAFGLDEVLKKVPIDGDSVKFNSVDKKTNF